MGREAEIFLAEVLITLKVKRLWDGLDRFLNTPQTYPDPSGGSSVGKFSDCRCDQHTEIDPPVGWQLPFASIRFLKANIFAVKCGWTTCCTHPRLNFRLPETLTDCFSNHIRFFLFSLFRPFHMWHKKLNKWMKGRRTGRGSQKIRFLTRLCWRNSNMPASLWDWQRWW